MFAIRPYHPSDLPALYRVCLHTGDSGQDASAIYRDPDLLAHVYVGPYCTFEPELCLTLTRNHAPVGYMIGTADSAGFHARCEADWFPPLRLQHPLPSADDNSRDASLVRIVHRGHPADPALAAYPAHLHIDLLPVAQGQGWGTKLMDAFLALLRARGVTGVHLGVGARNTGGIAFYRRYGFVEVAQQPWGSQFGMNLR